MVTNPPAMWETWVWPLGWEDSLEKGTATHSSILTWRIPWTEEPGGILSMWSWRDGYDWAAFTFSASLSLKFTDSPFLFLCYLSVMGPLFFKCNSLNNFKTSVSFYFSYCYSLTFPELLVGTEMPKICKGKKEVEKKRPRSEWAKRSEIIRSWMQYYILFSMISGF